MKKWIFLALVIVTMILLWKTTTMFLHRSPREHVMRQTFEEIEALK